MNACKKYGTVLVPMCCNYYVRDSRGREGRKGLRLRRGEERVKAEEMRGKG